MGPIVQTTQGSVRGGIDNGVSVFRGIPYAGPLERVPWIMGRGLVARS